MGQNETTTNELLLRIKEKYKKMSKGQRRLADYVCNDYDKAVFLTAFLGQCKCYKKFTYFMTICNVL